MMRCWISAISFLAIVIGVVPAGAQNGELEELRKLLPGTKRVERDPDALRFVIKPGGIFSIDIFGPLSHYVQRTAYELSNANKLPPGGSLRFVVEAELRDRYAALTTEPVVIVSIPMSELRKVKAKFDEIPSTLLLDLTKLERLEPVTFKHAGEHCTQNLHALRY